MKLDYPQRIEDFQEVLRTHVNGTMQDTWTALPGRIESVDLGAMTVHVQPTIQSLFTDADLKQSWVNLPVLPDVPIYCPRGGSYTLTFPVKSGDECLLVFSSRCIDNWWQQGGVQTQRELRMHDLSDGFALCGPFSQKTKIGSVSTKTVQLRSDDGKNFIEIDTDNKKITVRVGETILVVNDNTNSVEIQGNLRVSGAIFAGDGSGQQFTLNGSLAVTGAVIAGQGTDDQVGLQTHRHPTTGPPVPGT